MKSARAGRQGQTILLFTLAAIPLFGIMGLVVDVGWAYYRKQAAKTAADAAATAAALAAYGSASGSSIVCTTSGISCNSGGYTCPSAVPTTPTNNLEEGCLYAKNNGFVTSSRQKVVIRSGEGNAPSSNGVTISYWVTAEVSETIPQLFSAVLGHPTMVITARTTTGAKEATSGGCVIALDPSASGALSVNGTTQLQSGCGVFVNSTASDAITAVGGSIISTTGTAKTEIAGGWSGGGTITPAPVTGVAATGDPLADLEAPEMGTCKAAVSLGNKQKKTISPGTYCGGISLAAQSSLTLEPGLYIVTDGISLGGQTTMTGSGVTIYVKSGSVNLAGGANVNLTAPSSGDWQGILFYQDRADTEQASLVGGTDQILSGVVYFPSAPLKYTGGSSTNATATTVIGDTITMVGNSYFSAAATTRFTGMSGGVSIVD